MNARIEYAAYPALGKDESGRPNPLARSERSLVGSAVTWTAAIRAGAVCLRLSQNRRRKASISTCSGEIRYFRLPKCRSMGEEVSFEPSLQGRFGEGRRLHSRRVTC